MKTLLVGLGQIGLGLVVPVFQKAGFELVGTDASTERLRQLQNGYVLKTPSETIKVELSVQDMSDISDEFNLIITSVGRQHLGKVADWLKSKNIAAPVLLAENLPDPLYIFPKQIPIVVDRICPRVIMENDVLTSYAEDYFKIVVLNDQLIYPLGNVSGVELETIEMNLDIKRFRKLFTVNTCHVLTALYGQRFGCQFVHEAIKVKEIALRIESTVQETGQWLVLTPRQCHERAKEIISRFSSPLNDPLTRILNPNNWKSALRYIEKPLFELNDLNKKAKILEEAYEILSRNDKEDY